VPRLAIEYLGLDDDPRLYIRVGDALELLDTAEPADLILSTCIPMSVPASGTWPGLSGKLPETPESGRLAGDQPVGHR
jgi:hypothetical protein